MKVKFTSRELILLAVFAALGILSKPLLAPLLNLLTDFVRIPGGSSVAGFSLLFLVAGKQFVPKPASATMMALVQGIVALCLGISGVGVPLILLSYLLPGVVIDLLMSSTLTHLLPRRALAQLAGALGVLAGALLNNLLFFRLAFLPMLLFYLLGVISGAVGGTLADVLYMRLSAVAEVGSKDGKGT